MSASRDQLYSLLDQLDEEELDEVWDFAKVLSSEPDELTDEERAGVQAAEDEFRRGDWVKWEDVRRGDV